MGLRVVQRYLDHLRNLLLFSHFHKQIAHKCTVTQSSTVKCLWVEDAWRGGRTSWLVSAALSVHLLNDCFLCVSQWAGAAFLHLLHYWVRRSLKTWLSSSMTSLGFQRLVCGVKQTSNNITTAVKLQNNKLKSTIKFHNIQLMHCVSGFWSCVIALCEKRTWNYSSLWSAPFYESFWPKNIFLVLWTKVLWMKEQTFNESSGFQPLGSLSKLPRMTSNH